jgi:hypothetical protein
MPITVSSLSRLPRTQSTSLASSNRPSLGTESTAADSVNAASIMGVQHTAVPTSVVFR